MKKKIIVSNKSVPQLILFIAIYLYRVLFLNYKQIYCFFMLNNIHSA